MSPYLPYQQPGDVDPPLPPPEVLSRHRARVLDPTNAVLLKDQRIRPTMYVADELLVAASDRLGDPTKHALEAAAGRLDLDVTFPDPPGEGEPEPGAQLVTVAPKDGTAALPDAWVVLQGARALNRGALAGVGLNHLLSVTLGGVIGQHEPHGGASTNALYEASTIAEYGWPGLGGRTPVLYVGRRPHRQNSLNTRRPVVALLDMGCAEHEWLPTTGQIVNRTPRLDTTEVGMPGPGLEDPFSDGPMDGRIHWAFGHGTFNCGLIRQICPDADLISARVVQPDGLVREWTLAKALERIYELARRWVDGEGGHPVDVVSLSLGYYHEELTDPLAGEAIYAAVENLGRIGVVVVASAGNDATQRRLFPAAWSEIPPAPDSAPLVSVGALNPDRSVALFSNGGEWVRHWEPGVAVVSSVPSYNGGANASAEAVDPSQQRRRSFDPDCFRRGYAIWSGTSFAAPVLAGKLARRLIRNSNTNGISLDDQGRHAAVQRAVDAVGRYVR